MDIGASWIGKFRDGSRNVIGFVSILRGWERL